jgi:outer membrane receptor protein involved in Fe transport
MLTLVSVFVLFSAAVGAQETTTGAIEGRVVDPQGLALPGVTVSITSAQGAQSFVTDSEGRFLAPFLTPGAYTVRAELTGFRPIEQQNVQVRLGQRVTLPLQLALGELTEQVEVRAEAPAINVTTPAVATNLDTEMLSRIPIGRRFSDTLYIAPGVSTGGTVGQANPSISGGSGLENQYIVDGVDIKNPGYGGLGSYSIVFGSLGTGTPYDFIQEVQVKTAGYEAEFGQSTGGVVNVVTKSGTNDLRGSVFGYFRPRQLEHSFTQLSTVNGVVNQQGTQLNDAGITVGGPLLRDRLFFFGAVDPQWEQSRFSAPSDFPLATLGSVPRDRRVVNYAAKGTWQIASGNRLDLSFFGDPSKGSIGPQRSGTTGVNDPLLREDQAAFSSIDKYGGHNQSVRYSGVFGPQWLVEGGYARAANDVVESPAANEWQVTDRTVTPNIRTGGIGLYDQSNRGVNDQLMAKATNIFSSGVGDHQVRYGVQYQHVLFDNIIQRTGPTIVLPDGQRTTTGAQVSVQPDPVYGSIYRVTRANITNVRHTTQNYLNLFVQDTWKIGNRLTITPGVRYEQQQLKGSLTDLTLDGNWAPRLGVVFDPTGVGRARIYANWGLFYAQIPNDLAARALSPDASVSRADYFDAALTRPVPEGVLAASVTNHYQLAGLSADQIDPNVKASYLNEFLAGVEFQVAPAMNVGVRYIRRRIPRVLEDVQPFPLVACDYGTLTGNDALTEACAVDYVLTNPGASTPVLGGLGASFEDPIHHYDAVEFTADKRFASRWSLQGSYRWSRLWGTYEGFYRDDNGQSDPGITSLFDFPTNDPSYRMLGAQFTYRGDIRFLGSAGAGPLPLDRPHQAKLFANYSFPVGLNLGLGISAKSGRPLTALAANPSYTNAGEIPESPRGEGFQTADGFRTRAPFQYDTNMHVDYSFAIGGNRRIVLLADVFNLLNTQRIYDYNNWTETSFGASNPDFGQPYSAVLGLPAFQTPRQLRLGARIDF